MVAGSEGPDDPELIQVGILLLTFNVHDLSIIDLTLKSTHLKPQPSESNQILPKRTRPLIPVVLAAGVGLRCPKWGPTHAPPLLVGLALSLLRLFCEI